MTIGLKIQKKQQQGKSETNKKRADNKTMN